LIKYINHRNKDIPMWNTKNDGMLVEEEDEEELNM
jgi:hypothetical protein